VQAPPSSAAASAGAPPTAGRAAPAGRPARVCFIIDQLSAAGTEMQLLALIRHLDRRRVKPYLCLLKGTEPESRALEPRDCPVVRLDVRSLHHPATFAKAMRFARYLRKERIDVVQVYFPDSTNFGVTVARIAGVPAVVRTRFNLGYWMTQIDRWLGRLHTMLVDATVTNCDVCRDAVVADEWADPGSVHVIENGVDLAPFARLPAPVFDADGARPRRVGLVANLRPVKDPQLFVEAARHVAEEHPDVEFHLAGEGELRRHLEHLIGELHLGQRVVLRGRVKDIPRFLASVDLAVLCSRSEGASNAILEYMAAGRAVVATAVGGTPQLLEDGVHGLLVPPGNAPALATALLRLLDDPALAARLAAAARQRVRERHDARVRAGRYEALYDKLLASARGQS
jgi:glycosyltransferase involved in cell wall biosynthesis